MILLRPSLSLRRTLLPMLLVAAPAALPAQSFEGVITANTSTGNRSGKPTPVVIQVKGTSWRMDTDMGGGPGSVIADGQGNVTMVSHARKSWTRPPMMQMKQGADLGDYSFSATGKKDKVLDYECEYYRVKNASEPKDDKQWCITSALGYVGYTPLRQLSNSNALKKTFPKGFFLLKGTDDKGAVFYEVTKVEKKSLDDALFAPPADYKEMQMPGMPAGMPPAKNR
jgi:Domain of unknown function (DUF4412)